MASGREENGTRTQLTRIWLGSRMEAEYAYMQPTSALQG
jgi:hypothetical protein